MAPPPIDRARYRREGEAAVAAFIAAGGVIQRCPSLRRLMAEKIGVVQRRLPPGNRGWTVLIKLDGIRAVAAYEADNPDTEQPKKGDRVAFELVPIGDGARWKATNVKKVRRAD